jgi:hypothetical protein
MGGFSVFAVVWPGISSDVGRPLPGARERITECHLAAVISHSPSAPCRCSFTNCGKLSRDSEHVFFKWLVIAVICARACPKRAIAHSIPRWLVTNEVPELESISTVKTELSALFWSWLSP